MFPRLRWLWLLVALAWAGLSPSAAAAVQRLPAVQVALWPEYDRPGVLVMYDLHLPTDTPLPAEVALRIPARVRAPSAVAVRTSDGRLLNAEYRIEADPQSTAWRVVMVTATEQIVHVEYYDPGLEIDGAARRFVYQWPGDWEVGTLTIEVQHPRTGVAIAITPEPARVETRSDSLRYYLLEFTAVKAGQEVQVEVAYQNPTGELTMPPEQMPALSGEATVTPVAEPVQTWSPKAPLLLALVGVVLLFLAAWLYRRGGGQAPAYPARPSRKRDRPRPPGPPVAADEVRYCSQCGTRARPGDRYCRRCGAPLS